MMDWKVCPVTETPIDRERDTVPIAPRQEELEEVTKKILARHATLVKSKPDKAKRKAKEGEEEAGKEAKKHMANKSTVAATQSVAQKAKESGIYASLFISKEQREKMNDPSQAGKDYMYRAQPTAMYRAKN